MTELQLALLAIGALVVAGVFAYNRLQERGARRAAERAFRPPAVDALLDEPPARAAEAHPPGGRIAASRAPVLVPVGALPDPRIDYVVELRFSEPADPSSLLALWKEHEHRYARRALLACTSDGAQWLPLDAAMGSKAQALRAGLQLASRDGAIAEAELIEFRAALDSLASASGASIEAPEMRQAVEQARGLDDFCADADIQVVLHVMPQAGAGFDELAVGDAAEEAGLAAEADDRFVLRDDEGRELFTLAWREGAAANGGLSVALEVPRAPGGGATFQAMARFARQLAAALEGTLVDDNGHAIDARSLAAIEAQLGTVHAAFAGKGIEPGSATALRLFS